MLSIFNAVTEVSQLTFYGSQDFILFDILVMCSGLRLREKNDIEQIQPQRKQFKQIASTVDGSNGTRSN